MRNIGLLILSLATAHLAGIIGSFYTVSSIEDWYQYLEKPFFNPPNWIFAPVWLGLYTLMGIAVYLILKKGLTTKRRKIIVSFYFLHLILNSLWSIVFFGNQNLLGAFIIITILWLMIASLIYLFYSENKIAGYLLIPYLAWVSFAAILNYFILQLN